MKRLLLIMMSLVFILSSGAQAADEILTFSKDEYRERFHRLSQELRCLVCQNQSIADSSAGLANDLRAELYRMVESDMSEKEIIEFMTQRYGDFVLYRPPVKAKTAALWFGPFILAVVGVLGMIVFLRRRNRALAAAVPAKLNEEEQKRIQALLNNTDAGNAPKQ
ncbi:MAG: cytochrome c-type biogenesis protein CcmH [Gammaproteobacteria bacterium]|nr:cytochrome c-type biogenesis protein CcmH [Gammaproteobacteria bacterium]